uniref:FERM domain containing kindlin 3b n=1 Tax=Cyclopterus lumpus TaxID=8103 RepID=A0A8C2XD23_CYCLU
FLLLSVRPSSPSMAAWDLSVTVEDLGSDAPPVTLSVASELHVGGVILQLVEKTQIKRDWSDHALWWEQKQRWLLRTAWTLEKYGIHADARLMFMPQHKPLKLGLPNGTSLRLRGCFSSSVFQTVMGICRMLSESKHFLFISFRSFYFHLSCCSLYILSIELEERPYPVKESLFKQRLGSITDEYNIHFGGSLNFLMNIRICIRQFNVTCIKVSRLKKTPILSDEYYLNRSDSLASFLCPSHKCLISVLGVGLIFIVHTGCEVAPDVNVTAQKFLIRLLIPAPEGMNEVYLRCENEQQYAQWMAACRLASKGKTLADSSFQNEIQSIRSFLAMQKTSSGSHGNAPTNDESINPHSLVSPRYHKKYKAKQLTPRILDAYQNVAQLSLTDALMRFLQIWQALPDFGLSYVVVRFKGSRKDEVLGIAPNRLIRIDLAVGDVVKTWRYNNMKQWNVNWDIRQVAIEFEGNINIAFGCLTADCKIVHEFIGGYIFMSTRSRAKSDTLNEELFYKLTGGHEAL